MKVVFEYWTPPGWGNDKLKRAVVEGHETDYEHRYWVYLGNLLSGDYQLPSSCERMLAQIESIETGTLQQGGWSGNAWRTTVDRTGVQIDSHTVPWWDEQPEGHFELEVFKTAIIGWKRFLSMPVSLETRVEIDLPDC